MPIRIPHDRTFIVIGLGKPLRTFINRLRFGAFPSSRIVVVTDPDHDQGTYEYFDGLEQHRVFATAPERLLEVVAKHPGCSGVVLQWYGIFPSSIVEAFEGRLFNLHFGDLPRYRGAGGFSWQVLNGETVVRAHIQVMTKKVDAGPVVMTEAQNIHAARPYPQDFITAAAEIADAVVARFASNIGSGVTLEAVDQDERAAEYYPKLLTAKNGLIDFSWPAEAIDRFVRAFSTPYPGAAFNYDDVSYRVRRSQPVSSKPHHPFAAGLIVNKTSDGLFVATSDGVLLFSDIAGPDGDCELSKFRIGGRLYNEDAALLAARRYR